MANPFENPDASYFVLINEEGQHSLWPVFAEVPDGWEVAFGEAEREECLAFVEKSWTDMRPTSLIKAMESQNGSQNGSLNGSQNGKKKRAVKTG